MGVLAIFGALGGALGRASLQGAAVIAAVWLVCRLVPRLPASLRCGLWWLACAKLVLGLVWAEPVRLAVLPAQAAIHAPRVETLGYAQLPLRGTPLALRKAELPRKGEGIQPRVSTLGTIWIAWSASWPAPLLTLWAAGVLLLLGVTAGQHWRAQRVVRRATPVEEPWLRGLFSSLRDRLGAPRRTGVLLSAEIETPQVVGLLRPVVLLPAAAPGRLSRPEIAMTLCHELLHVRRGDLWLGWVPALAQRLFFFHPLSHLAAREYALAREAACDADVLRLLDPAPESYGRLLVRLGVTPQTPRLAAAGAAPSFQILKRRLQMLQHASGKKRLHPAWWTLIVLGAVLALIPFTITAQEARRPLPPPAIAPATPATPTAPAAPVAPLAPVLAADEPGEVPPVPAVAPAAPLPAARIAQGSGHGIPPVPPVPPRPPRPPVPPRPPMGGHGDEPFVLLMGHDHTVMNGSMHDVERARKLRKSDDEQLLWFERGGKSYVVRDAATLSQVRALFEPQQKLGEQQAELGEKQAKLGEQQAALGAQQAAQGAKQAAVGTKMAKVAAEQAHLAGQGKNSASLEAEMQELERQQEDLSKPQEDLSRQQEELGRRQEALGRQQEELGKKQEELGREAEKQMKALMDKAIANGIAQEVK
jgi:bla regulator protein blaR1